MIEQWQPATATGAIDSSLLLHLASESHQAEELNSALLDTAQLQQLQQWTQQPEQTWQTVLTSLDEQQLLAIARWYVKAEEHYGWQVGANNPAIWIFRYLKQQQRLPAKDEIRAIKAMTSNRYIPYGKVL
ncbi:hypothetical protein CHH28_17225 [Bacterioplanes sanyensis]|uniref:Uncharacterized protein n=1 Tax=Bacterioplanes sanyensis TaxID=1249553 RepID=A0A222FNN7_9GAMM|nr:hypothetical protein [Bacterioplanes sanyensis]ASP40312.1 hypothetical protein CHH28_17225 [Bacterioplanes sanyensis]